MVSIQSSCNGPEKAIEHLGCRKISCMATDYEDLFFHSINLVAPGSVEMEANKATALSRTL